MQEKEQAVIRPVDYFVGTRESSSPQERQAKIEKAARVCRESMLSSDPCLYYESSELIRVPYPSKYAFLNAGRFSSPFIHIVNKMFVVQFETSDGVKTLLVSPSDIHGNRETPFFKRLDDKSGPFKGTVAKVIAPVIATVEEVLVRLGIRPENVDYITYDHLHTQDLRKWLGNGKKPGFFPNAKLLVMRQEWESAKALLPPQRDWYCPNGMDDIPMERIVLLDGDSMLGDSVMLMHTPGHTEGNHSIVVHTPEGLMVTSENGVGPDSYAPHVSKIPGLAQYARATGMEVILNGNTLEGGLNQYLSMIQEREVAGRSARNPEFFNVVCSSELKAYWGFPGVKPTFSFGELRFGNRVL